MRYWLMKSEPDEFSIDDLARAKNQTTAWFGVRNFQARNFMRDQMKVGDLALFYHSSCPEPGIAGIVKVVAAAHPDESQFDSKSPYYDAKSTREAPRWVNVDVALV
ncbi:MAG TPA: EVE domain-containing protein, partial [Casimicrobiaceae bacterium]|nr:EVE domain-containing protein [Casimicrobiaceae bacterium]